MLINKQQTNTGHVKFISYDGKYPNLCSGILTLDIDGIEYTFGSRWLNPKPDFDKFWDSGGNVSADKNWNFDVSTGEWLIYVDEIPEQFQKYAREIDEVFNENVEYGCCGGCV